MTMFSAFWGMCTIASVVNAKCIIRYHRGYESATVDELFKPDLIKVHKTRRTLISSKKPKNQTSLGKRTQSRSIEPATKKPPGNGLHLDRSPAKCHGRKG